jgi:hypothetical protein
VGQDISYVAFCVDGEEVDYDVGGNAQGYVFLMTVDGLEYITEFGITGETLYYESSPEVDSVVLKAGRNQYLFDGATSDTVDTAGTPVANPTSNASPCGEGQVGVKYDGAFETDDGPVGPPA